jgi:hypothetical protein
VYTGPIAAEYSLSLNGALGQRALPVSTASFRLGENIRAKSLYRKGIFLNADHVPALINLSTEQTIAEVNR